MNTFSKLFLKFLTMQELFTEEKNCCGCEACVQVCPVSIVEMKADKQGFFYPRITDSEKCISCKSCEKVCPLKNRMVSPRKTESAYTGFANDINIVKNCASGGIATTIATCFISDGGIVYGVKYSKDCLFIEYSRAESTEELRKFRGSKYAQSRKHDIFKRVWADLKDGQKVLFIGLPCDVAALYNFLRNNNQNLYTIELVCHGVTSPNAHHQFVKSEMSEHHSRMKEFSVRYKKVGWKPYYIYEKYENGSEVVMPFRPTDYGIVFHFLKRPSCYACKFKIYDDAFGLQADLTVGDNHGASESSPSYNLWGSSVCYVHTDKGQYLLKSIAADFKLNKEKNVTTMVKHNLALFKPFPKKSNYDEFTSEFAHSGLHAACTHPSTAKLESLLRKRKRISAVKLFFYKISGLRWLKDQFQR